MDRQVVSSVWSYEPKYDLHIAKFLELLLKYEYVWCEQDEKDFRISLSEHKRILFAEDFREFQKGLTSFDIAIQVKNIRKLYNEELVELEKAGKSENDSKFPWFSKARSLFSGKTDREKEILRHENSSVSSEDPPVSTSSVALPNFQEKYRKSSSLPPTQVSSSSKTATVALTPIMTSVLTTTTFSSLRGVNPSLMADPKPYTVRQPLTKTTDFSIANTVSRTTNCSAHKSCFGTISKASIVSSPYEMTTNSLKIRHPFSPPTSISPASRIPLRMRPISSTAGSPLPPTTASFVVRSPLSPMVKSSTDRATPSSSTISSRYRIGHLPTASSKTEVTSSPIATPWNTRVPRPTKTIFSRAEGPIFMNSQTSRIRAPLKHHRPPTSYRQGVPLSLAASSPRTGVSPLHIALSCSPGVFTSTVPSSRAIVFTPAAPSSSDGVLTSDALSSRDGLPNLPYRSPPPYTPGVPPSSISTSSSIKVSPLQIAPSSDPDVFRSTVPSSRADVLASLGSSSREGVITTAAPSSRDGLLPSDALASRDGVFNLPYRSPPPYTPGVPPSSISTSSSSKVSPLQIPLSTNPDIFRSADPLSSPGTFMSAVPSSKDDVLGSLTLSSSDDLITTAAPSSGDGVPTSDAPSSRDGLPNVPYRSPSPYRQGVNNSTVVSSSRAKVSFMRTSPSLSTGVLTSAASFSSTGLPFSPTTPYSRTGVISPTALSSGTRLSLSPTASSSGTRLPLSPTALSSGTGLPLSPTASRSNTGVPLSPSLATSPTRTSVLAPQISPLKCPFSPRKVAYF